jgi:hypothetical protein
MPLLLNRFAHELLINNKTDMTLRGSLLASKVSTSIGDLNITGIPIRTAIELKGSLLPLHRGCLHGN